MLNDADASGFKKVYLAMGFTDLRRGIDGLAGIIRFQFNLDPYDKNTSNSRTRRAAFHDVIVQNAENKKLINQGIPCGIHSI